MRARRIVIVGNMMPGHDIGAQQSGGAAYLQSFFDHFRAAGFEITFVLLRPNVDFLCRRAGALGVTLRSPAFASVGRWLVLRSPRGLARLAAWKLYLRLPRFAKARIDALRSVLRNARGYAHNLGRAPSPREVAYVRDVVAQVSRSFVMYDGIFNSCGRLNAGQHWVITQDVKHQRAASFASHGVSVFPAAFDDAAERALLEGSGNVIAIQWDDAREFKRLSPGSQVVVVPVTMALPARARARARHAPTPGRCLFVGSGSYHNYHGIRWFLAECWPAIRAAVPDATLDVVGSVCFRLPSAPPGVTYRGVVKDLAGVYAEAAVTVVPLQIGSGLKVKLIEALGYEQAIVTTSVGAQGMSAFWPRPFALANSGAAFAAETVAVLKSPERQAELREYAYHCARAFTPDVAFAELDAAMSGNLVPA